ncbi:MAG: hypothetical protein WBG42_00085 [Cryomorphaceae bacterium]
MENWQSWMISTIVVLIGMVAKFLLEIYLPEIRREKINIKRTGINTFMTLLLLYLFGKTAFRLFTEPWTQELEIYTLFQAFLFIGFVSFLVIMRIFRKFFDDSENDGESKGQSAKESQTRILMQ